MNLPLLTEKFNCTERNGRIEFEFTTQHNVKELRFEPEDHQLFREFSFVKGRDVYIYGKGPNEAYASLAFYLTMFQAKSIICQEYILKRDFLLHDSSIQDTQRKYSERHWFDFSIQFPMDNIEILRNPADPQGFWEAGIYNHLECLALPDDAGNSPTVCLTGKGGPVMYAALACCAFRSGYNELVVAKPTEANLLVFNDRVAGRELPRDNAGAPPGRCVGIVGDPCSGKSVFSQTFFHCICNLYPPSQVWVYDCDMMAPTPNWYLRGLASEDQQYIQEFKKRRDGLKSKWDSTKENQIAQHLQNLKTNIQLVIADLPGGNHKVKPPQRIPDASRAEMMRQCDAFIVLCRKDKPNVFDDWVSALKEYGLGNRVIAKVTTDAPKGPVAVSELAKTADGLLTCEIQGLDREKGSQLIDVLKPTLEELGRELQRHFGQSYEVL